MQPKNPSDLPPAPDCGPVAQPRPAPGAIVSETLFQGQPTVEILHEGQRYVLRQTREKKLILTK